MIGHQRERRQQNHAQWDASTHRQLPANGHAGVSRGGEVMDTATAIADARGARHARYRRYHSPSRSSSRSSSDAAAAGSPARMPHISANSHARKPQRQAVQKSSAGSSGRARAAEDARRTGDLPPAYPRRVPGHVRGTAPSSYLRTVPSLSDMSVFSNQTQRTGISNESNRTVTQESYDIAHRSPRPVEVIDVFQFLEKNPPEDDAEVAADTIAVESSAAVKGIDQAGVIADAGQPILNPSPPHYEEEEDDDDEDEDSDEGSEEEDEDGGEWSSGSDPDGLEDDLSQEEGDPTQRLPSGRNSPGSDHRSVRSSGAWDSGISMGGDSPELVVKRVRAPMPPPAAASVPPAARSSPAATPTLASQRWTGEQHRGGADHGANPGAMSLRKNLAGYDLIATSFFRDAHGEGRQSQMPTPPTPLYRGFEHLRHRALLHLQDIIAELEGEVRRLDEAIAPYCVDAQGARVPQSRRFDRAQVATMGAHRHHLLDGLCQYLVQYNTLLTSFQAPSQSGAALEPATPDDVSHYRDWLAARNAVVVSELAFLDHASDLVRVGGAAAAKPLLEAPGVAVTTRMPTTPSTTTTTTADQGRPPALVHPPFSDFAAGALVGIFVMVLAMVVASLRLWCMGRP